MLFACKNSGVRQAEKSQIKPLAILLLFRGDSCVTAVRFFKDRVYAEVRFCV